MPILNQGALGEITIVDSSGTAISTVDPADGLAEPALELAVGAQPFLWNGSTVDRARAGASSGLLLGTQKVVAIDSVSWQQSYSSGDDKKFTVPSNKVWEIHSVFVRIVCDGTSGDRALQCVVNDSSEDVFNFIYTMAMTAGNTYFWTLTPYLNYTTMATEKRAFGGIPPNLFLKEAYFINILDANTVSTSDTWAVNLFVSQYDE